MRKKEIEMKKKYFKPEMEIEFFDVNDVIVTSSETPVGDGVIDGTGNNTGIELP